MMVEQYACRFMEMGHSPMHFFTIEKIWAECFQEPTTLSSEAGGQASSLELLATGGLGIYHRA